MKGLLLKHGYVFWSNYKIYLFLTLLFMGMGWVSEEAAFAGFYPCILNSGVLTGMIGNDERDRWEQYVRTMPCRPAQIVGSYYLFGLVLAVGTALVCTLGQVVRVAVFARSMAELVGMVALMLPLSLLPLALMLPLVFRFGTGKALLAYYGVLGAGMGGIAILNNVTENMQIPLDGGSAVLVTLVALVLYGVSWIISIPLYKMREI